MGFGASAKRGTARSLASLAVLAVATVQRCGSRQSHDPHGINVILFFSLGIQSGRAPLGASNAPNATPLGINVNPVRQPVSFGIPDLSPIYSFGMRTVTHHPEDEDASSPLKAIGRIVTLVRHYDVSLVEQTALDGTDVYHLALRPLTDPDRYRLRELWISTSTYDVLQARVHGNFADRPASTIPWLISFSTIDGATYIASEAAEAPLPNRPVAFDAVAIDFENITARHGSRDLLFAIPGSTDTRGQVHEPDSGSNCINTGRI